MPTDKPQTSQSDLISVRKRVAMPGYNPLNPIRTILNPETHNFIKGIWNDLWGWVSGGSGVPNPQGGGSIIRDSRDATQRMVDEMRRRQTQ